MKHFYISLDAVDDVLVRLYEFCQESNYEYRVSPSQSLIVLYDDSGNTAADIELLNIVDGYDLLKELKNDKR